MIPVAPKNNLMVEITSKYNESITTEGGQKFYIDTTARPEWHVTITGKVVSLPRRVDFDKKYRNMPETLTVGTEILFSYLTIFDMGFMDDYDEVYTEDPMPSPFITVYSNRIGCRLLVQYRMDDKWNVAAFDMDGRVYEMEKGISQLQKDNWLGRFKFRNKVEVRYNNLVDLIDKEYWKVDIGHVMGIRTEEGSIQAVGGFVFLEPPAPDAPNGNKIILLNKITNAENQSAARIKSIGMAPVGCSDLGLKNGDRVFFDKRYAQQYTIDGSDYLVLRQDRILGKI